MVLSRGFGRRRTGREAVAAHALDFGPGLELANLVVLRVAQALPEMAQTAGLVLVLVLVLVQVQVLVVVMVHGEPGASRADAGGSKWVGLAAERARRGLLVLVLVLVLVLLLDAGRGSAAIIGRHAGTGRVGSVRQVGLGREGRHLGHGHGLVREAARPTDTSSCASSQSCQAEPAATAQGLAVIVSVREGGGVVVRTAGRAGGGDARSPLGRSVGRYLSSGAVY